MRAALRAIADNAMAERPVRAGTAWEMAVAAAAAARAGAECKAPSSAQAGVRDRPRARQRQSVCCSECGSRTPDGMSEVAFGSTNAGNSSYRRVEEASLPQLSSRVWRGQWWRQASVAAVGGLAALAVACCPDPSVASTSQPKTPVPVVRPCLSIWFTLHEHR